MTPGSFARIVHATAVEAIAAGAKPADLLKAALTGVVIAEDPSNRIVRVEVNMTTRLNPSEIRIEVETSESDRDLRVDPVTGKVTRAPKGG